MQNPPRLETTDLSDSFAARLRQCATILVFKPELAVQVVDGTVALGLVEVVGLIDENLLS